MKGQEFVGSAKVQEVLRLIQTEGRECRDVKTQGELLQAFSIFNARLTKALISVAQDHSLAFDSLVEEATDQILKRMNQAGQKTWSFNWDLQKQVEEELRSKFASLFTIAEKEQARLEEVSNLERRISNAKSSMIRGITALISTDEEVKEKEKQVASFVNESRIFTLNAELTVSERESIEKLIIEMKEELLQFIQVKKQERPVRLFYYKTGNGVAVKVDWDTNNLQYYVGDGNKFRRNRGKDSHEFSRIVSANYISDLLYNNNVRDEDIVIDPRSVKAFYSFNGKTSHNLTPAFINEWYNYDCPSIYRMVPNIEGHTNMIGMKICHFSNNLVESNWSDCYIDESITEAEAQAFMRDYSHTRISREIQNVLEARRMKESNQIEAVKEEVVAFDAKIQSFFDKKKDEMFAHLAKAFPNRSELKEEDGKLVFTMNDDFGLDCGFTYIHNKDKDYANKRSILSNATSMSKWMDVRLPYWTQSLTVQREQFNFLKEKLSQELGISLYAQHQYD